MMRLTPTTERTEATSLWDLGIHIEREWPVNFCVPLFQNGNSETRLFRVGHKKQGVAKFGSGVGFDGFSNETKFKTKLLISKFVKTISKNFKTILKNFDCFGPRNGSQFYQNDRRGLKFFEIYFHPFRFKNENNWNFYGIKMKFRKLSFRIKWPNRNW